MIVLYSCITLLITGIYLCWFGYVITGWAKLKAPGQIASSFKTKVSVLIAARNEEAIIRHTIEDILAQDYPKHLTEIIIVDDDSTDDTAAIISSYADRGVKLLKLTEEKRLNSYKKKAIAEAIALSGGELIVATDADCRMGPQWLCAIVSYFERDNPVIISSPVTYFQEHNLFELLQTLEFSYLIGFGAAYIGNKNASNCNGANLAYRKDVFYEVGGFKGIDDLASGDDEMLLQKIAAIYPNRLGFLKQREAIVYTHAKHTLQEFVHQRRRWASKSTRYKDKWVVAVVTVIWLFNLSLFVNGVGSFLSNNLLILFLVQFTLKSLFEFLFIMPVAGFLKRRELVWLIPIASVAHIMYIVYIGFAGNKSKYLWKGRWVN